MLYRQQQSWELLHQTSWEWKAGMKLATVARVTQSKLGPQWASLVGDGLVIAASDTESETGKWRELPQLLPVPRQSSPATPICWTCREASRRSASET